MKITDEQLENALGVLHDITGDVRVMRMELKTLRERVALLSARLADDSTNPDQAIEDAVVAELRGT